MHDLNVEATHNFVAGGLVTHNSIYSFRGADITNILNFEDDYVDAHVVRLEQNYRSTQMILSAANAVSSNNRGRKSKSLWTDIGEGDPIKVRELADEHAEARFVAAEIERLVDEGVSRSEIAVFYRTNAQSRVLEDMLVRAQIGYQVIGGTKFYERAEVKDAVAYLTFLVNPADGGAFTRVANSPRRGIGQTSLSRVLAHADTMGITPWEAAATPENVPSLGTAAQKALGRFMSTMERLAERAAAGAPVAELLEETLRETGYLEALAAERTIEAQGRIENLEEFVRVAREYDGMAGAGEDAGVAEFLQQIALIADADQIRDDEGLVTLMTLHNAKGLEFPIVFIIGCEDGVFPHSRAIDEGSLEEERRLAYVGITRAMRDLYITYARRRNVFGAESFGLRSRFIDEIPRELTDQPDRNAVGVGRPAGTGRVASWATAAAASAETLAGPAATGGRGRRRRRPGLPDGRRRRPRGVRRRRRARDRARRDRRRALRVGRLAAQADGRLRADPQALSVRAGLGARPRARDPGRRAPARAAARRGDEPADLAPRDRRARRAAARDRRRPARVRRVARRPARASSSSSRRPARRRLGAGALRPRRPLARRRRGGADGRAASGGGAAARAGLARRPGPARGAAGGARSASPPSGARARPRGALGYRIAGRAAARWAMFATTVADAGAAAPGRRAADARRLERRAPRLARRPRGARGRPARRPRGPAARRSGSSGATPTGSCRTRGWTRSGACARTRSRRRCRATGHLPQIEDPAGFARGARARPRRRWH